MYSLYHLGQAAGDEAVLHIDGRGETGAVEVQSGVKAVSRHGVELDTPGLAFALLDVGVLVGGLTIGEVKTGDKGPKITGLVQVGAELIELVGGAGEVDLTVAAEGVGGGPLALVPALLGEDRFADRHQDDHLIQVRGAAGLLPVLVELHNPGVVPDAHVVVHQVDAGPQEARLPEEAR